MKSSRFFRRTSTLFVVILVISMLLTGCGGKPAAGNESTPPASSSSASAESSKAPSQPELKPVTITYMVFSTEAYDAYQKLDMPAYLKKYAPHITVEIEKVKDSGEFENALKIRKAADELPDIMPMKPYMLANYKDALAPLNDLEVAKNISLQNSLLLMEISLVYLSVCLMSLYGIARVF